MIIRPLWSLYSYPGLSDSLLHFTGRIADEPNSDLPAAVAGMTPPQRLVAILNGTRLTACYPYWPAGDPSICFTEATQLGLAHLVERRRYAPWALGFDKQHVFDAGGGPAFYVRGDDWDAFRESTLPSRLKAFGTPFWPGADPEPGGQALPAHLSTVSQWYHEREWRLPRTETQRDFTFPLDSVRFLVVPTDDGLAWLQTEVRGLNAHLAHIRVMMIPAPSAEVDEEDEHMPGYDWTDPFDPGNPYADVIKGILGLS